MGSMRDFTALLWPILDDIAETHRQIHLTKSDKRKSQLRRHIEKQHIKIKQMTQVKGWKYDNKN